MAEEHKGDDDHDALEGKEARRINRMVLKEVSEDMADNQQEMKNVHSRKFANMLKRYEEVAKRMVDPDTRELIAGATCLRHLTGAVKGQAQTLSDVSGRLSWQDLSASISNRFKIRGVNGGLDWGRLGSEARQVFNTAPSFTTMVGPIHKEERVRKIAVRRQRENLAGVVNVTSEKIVNEEDDGNDEATNARVAHLMRHLESFAGQEFDLLKTLVDPVDPVQSVENFFDYSYLHKEKKVKHVFDEETGTLTACIAEPGELDNAPKTQMVLSFSISDLKHMAEVLYPEVRGNANSKNRSSRFPLSHPLHREDPLYDSQDVEEQVRLLAKHTRQLRTQSGGSTAAPRVRNSLTSPQQRPQQQQARSATQPIPGSNSAGLSASIGASTGTNIRTSSGTSNGTSRGAIATSSATQAQSSSSHRTTTSNTSSHVPLLASLPSYSHSTVHNSTGLLTGASSSRSSSENYDRERVRLNGSSSSRHSVTHPSNVYPANGKGTERILQTPVCLHAHTPVNSPGTACSDHTAASAPSAVSTGQNYSSYSPISPPVSLQAAAYAASGLSASPARTGTPGSVSSARTAASFSTANPPYTPVGSTAARRVATPGTASSTASSIGTAVTSASVSPLVVPSSTPIRVTNGFDRPTTRIAAAPAATGLSQIGPELWQDTQGRNRRAPPSPSLTPTPPRVARAVHSTTSSVVAPSSTARFAPIAPTLTRESSDLLNSHDSSRDSTPTSSVHTNGDRTSTNKANASTSGKRALDLEELGRANLLSQGSAKRRATEVAPVLPHISVCSAAAAITENVQRSHQKSYEGNNRDRNKESGQKERMEQRGRQTYRDSPESVHSERTENMFVSASDSDSDSSSY